MFSVLGQLLTSQATESSAVKSQPLGLVKKQRLQILGKQGNLIVCFGTVHPLLLRSVSEKLDALQFYLNHLYGEKLN